MRKKILESIELILAEVKQRLKEIYGDNLQDIILYGSYARGDYTDDSDIDLIIVLKDLKDPSAEHEKYFTAIWELNLKYDTLISTLAISEEELKRRRLPIILCAKNEGITI